MDIGFDCEEFQDYRVDLPYPTPNIQRSNLQWARLVSGIFAGQGSETTAIAQYATHRFYLNDYPEVSNAYQYIAATEMIHFNLLGHLVRNLGLKPKLYSHETRRFWSGRYPEYRYTLKEIIASDIEGERGAIAHYTRLIGEIDDAGIQALFRRIILDEERHIEVLNALYSYNT